MYKASLVAQFKQRSWSWCISGVASIALPSEFRKIANRIIASSSEMKLHLVLLDGVASLFLQLAETG